MIGKTISHYKIIEKLGGGGMGVVYKAQDLKLDRFVALKFLPPELTRDEKSKKRFIHEAKATSALEHTNICNIHEIDETDDGVIFIVMSCYEGETLKKKIERGPLKIVDATNIIIQTTEGLTKAHEKNIIHRDIKPANIFITNDGVAKILDFGLAKVAGQTQLTQMGSTVGTVAYMSPEQTRGEKVDRRTDIWSLGVILYEMITGQLPFKGDYEQAVSYSIVNETQEPLTGLRTGVPMELERIVNRVLAKDPQDRYQHADDLLSELNRLKKESDSEIIPVKPEPEKKKKNVVLLPAIIFSIVVLIIAGYLLLKPSIPEKGELPASEWENSIAVLPFKNISADPEQEYFCDGMTDQIISNLAKLPQLKVISRTSVMKYKATEKTIPEIGKELNVAHILEGSVQKIGGRIRVIAQLIGTKDDFHLWTEKYDKEYKELFDIQDEVSEAIATNLLASLSQQEKKEIKTDRPDRIENYDRYMQAKGFHHKFLETQNPDYLQDAILLLKGILKQEPDYLSANVELADVYNSYFNMVAKTDEEKRRYVQLQKKYIDIAYSINPKSLDVLYIKIFVSIAEQGIKYYGEIRLKKFMEYLKIDPNRASAYFYVGIWLRDYDLVHQSLLYFNKAVELNPLYTWNCSNRGWAYFLIGEFEKAELDYKKALEIEPHYYYNLGRYIHYLISFKRIKEAEKLISQWQDKKPNDNILEQLRAWLYAVKGDKENALSSFNKTTFEKEYDASFTLAIVYLLLNDQEKAIELIIEGEKDYSSSTISYDMPVGICRSKYFGYLNLPYYKILHNDSRFQAILSKHKQLYEENLRKYGDI